jgi:hypothetical protein
VTELALAARNMLAQKSAVTSLLGDDALWDTWIFVDVPQAVVENSQSVMVVIAQVAPWADPTRNADGSVMTRDAKMKIEAAFKAIDKFMHLVHKGPSNPYWGTLTEITTKTGVRIVDSKRAEGDIDFNPSFDNQGGYMGRVHYNITL